MVLVRVVVKVEVANVIFINHESIASKVFLKIVTEVKLAQEGVVLDLSVESIATLFINQPV